MREELPEDDDSQSNTGSKMNNDSHTNDESLPDDRTSSTEDGTPSSNDSPANEMPTTGRPNEGSEGEDPGTNGPARPTDDPPAESAHSPFEPGHSSTAAENLLPKPVETCGDGTVVTSREPRVYSIPKHTYCHRCEYFSEPPAVNCLHEGTTILEVERLDTFRVSNCPVAIEAEELDGER